ncbi:hypothetical protein FKB36_12930 [Methanoculleus sp. Afa-1]|jgi:hypothetical protein|uniref:Uncharacterized protein n=1 Tax=Methanoculleus formosensis TaxID=2590886 RepID=A0A9E4ZNJ1_9EURY|nr:hypothetical protein [Methanoculleus sp. Afa-1]MCT8338364.1 hypothetical protein [Methanoculleus sp. Afa-1]
MAILLIAGIQVLVVGGLVACIVVGAQDRPSPETPPITEARYMGDWPASASAAAYPIAGHQAAGILSGAGETFILFAVGDDPPTPSRSA